MTNDITAERIRERRIELGLTQDELALMVGYSGKSSINKIEKDTRGMSIDKMKEIAKALHVSPAYIMGWDEDENVPFGEDIDKYNEQHIDVDLLPRDRTEELIIRIYRTLSPEDKETVTKLIERLAPPEQGQP